MTTTDYHYYIPEGSHWPIIAAIGIITTLFGVVMAVNGAGPGGIIMSVGLVILAYLFFGWFGDVIDESMSGKYNKSVDASFRQGMAWFIGSEVFFFATFFGCLYYLRAIVGPWLGGEGHLGDTNMLWEGFTFAWPMIQLPDASTYTTAKEAMGPMGIPLLNTIILLSSGGTLTWAHWGLKKDNKTQLVLGLLITVALGVTFFGFQAYEYYHAYHAMDLTLNSGIYGSTFYMLTGFHGFHVIIGTIMLIVMTVRAIKGHFSHEHHFAFEAAAWYWHFVDVVWIGLFFFVYWL